MKQRKKLEKIREKYQKFIYRQQGRSDVYLKYFGTFSLGKVMILTLDDLKELTNIINEDNWKDKINNME